MFCVMELLYVTFSSLDEAKGLGENLLNEKLAACVNIHPITSIYEWEGEIVDENEFVAVVKTTTEKLGDAKSFIEKNHSYDTPCILHITCDANEKYEKWVEKTVD